MFVQHLQITLKAMADFNICLIITKLFNNSSYCMFLRIVIKQLKLIFNKPDFYVKNLIEHWILISTVKELKE